MTEYLYQELTQQIIGAAIEVHRTLGTGFPERVYQIALEHELTLRHLPIESQMQVMVMYKGVQTAEYFMDIVVDNKVILELKALADLDPIHESQAVTYTKASGLRLVLLLNFGRQRLQTKRVAL